MRRLAILTLLLVTVATGCAGSSDDDARETEAAPPARTRDEWASRLYHRFLKDVDRDLRVLNMISNPTIKIYLYSGNEETLRTLDTRLSDLRECSQKLERVGAPPAENTELEPILRLLYRACPRYERVASLVLEGAPLLSSEDKAEQRKGGELLRRAGRPSRLAAQSYGQALQLIEQQGLLRRVVPEPSS